MVALKPHSSLANSIRRFFKEAMALVAKKQREEREKKIREQMAAEAKKKGLNKSPAVRGAARPGGPQRPGGQPGAVGLRPSFQYNDGVFVCDICKKSFKAGFEMVTHWKTHIKAAHGAAAAGRGRGVLAGRGGRGGLAGGRGKGKGAVEVVDLDAEPKVRLPIAFNHIHSNYLPSNLLYQQGRTV